MTKYLKAEDFENAAEILSDPDQFQKENYGFAPHHGGPNDQGSYCFLGAVTKVAFQRIPHVVQVHWSKVLSEAVDLVDEATGIPYVADENDLASTTHDMMADVAIQTAKFLRDKGEIL